jgi:hypothetical protein
MAIADLFLQMALLEDSPKYLSYTYCVTDNPRQMHGMTLNGVEDGVWCAVCVTRIIDLALL